MHIQHSPLNWWAYLLHHVFPNQNLEFVGISAAATNLEVIAHHLELQVGADAVATSLLCPNN